MAFARQGEQHLRAQAAKVRRQRWGGLMRKPAVNECRFGESVRRRDFTKSSDFANQIGNCVGVSDLGSFERSRISEVGATSELARFDLSLFGGDAGKSGV